MCNLLRQNSGEIPENISIKSSEWKILKEMQRSERDNFFAGGKGNFSELRSEVWLSVKKEFAPRWEEYFLAKKQGAGADELNAMKKGILDDRKAVFEPLRDGACKTLLETRKTQYREILAGQRDQRQTLKWHQQLGLDTSDFFLELNMRREGNIVTEDFRQASRAVTQSSPDFWPRDRAGRDFSRAAVDVAEQPLARVGSVAASIAGGLFATLLNFGSPPPAPASLADKEETTRLAGEESTKHRDRIARDLDDEARRKRSRELHGRE
jgi:hypothetical protein